MNANLRERGGEKKAALMIKEVKEGERGRRMAHGDIGLNPVKEDLGNGFANRKSREAAASLRVFN